MAQTINPPVQPTQPNVSENLKASRERLGDQDANGVISHSELAAIFKSKTPSAEQEYIRNVVTVVLKPPLISEAAQVKVGELLEANGTPSVAFEQCEGNVLPKNQRLCSASHNLKKSMESQPVHFSLVFGKEGENPTALFFEYSEQGLESNINQIFGHVATVDLPALSALKAMIPFSETEKNLIESDAKQNYNNLLSIPPVPNANKAPSQARST